MVTFNSGYDHIFSGIHKVGTIPEKWRICGDPPQTIMTMHDGDMAYISFCSSIDTQNTYSNDMNLWNFPV